MKDNSGTIVITADYAKDIITIHNVSTHELMFSYNTVVSDFRSNELEDLLDVLGRSIVPGISRADLIKQVSNLGYSLF